MKAAYDIICVLDADCLLQPDAFKHALRHFRDEKVVAVGGRLLTMTDSKNNAYQPQSLEYKKTFNLIRPLFDHVNANFIISGAFGMFRKTALQRVGGYDTDTVGEDMELVLRLQELAKENGWKVVYEKMRNALHMFQGICIVCAVFAFNAYFVFTQSMGLPNFYQSWIIYGIYVIIH